MTVITLPSTGVKSDKVLLVDCESQRNQDFNHSMSATFNHSDPKQLESGEKEAIAVSSAKMLRIKLVLCLLMFALVLALSGDMMCKGYHKKVDAEHQQLQQQQQQDTDMDITDADAVVPYKSYESYAAAESDIMSLQPLPSSLPFEADDYDAGQLTAIDGLYRKLENDAFGRDSDTSNSAGESEVDRQKGDNIVLPIPEMKSTRFIHDFSINVTGIVDVEKQCCFVLPLMRSPASKSFSELLFKISTGYFAIDIKEIMGNMRVVKPPLKDLSNYGLYISKDCANYSTFKLEKCDDTVTAATTTVAADAM